MPKNIGSISKKIVLNSILNFSSVAHFWLCLLETQVWHNTGPKCSANVLFTFLSCDPRWSLEHPLVPGPGDQDITSLLRRLQAQNLPDEAPPIGKIHRFNKMTVTFESLMGF